MEINKKLLRSLFLGVAGCIVLYWVLNEPQGIVELFSGGSEYLDANLIAWVAGVIFAFVTNKLFVFESKSWKPSVAVKEFTGFMSARIFSLIVEMLGMFVMVTLLVWNEFIAKIIVGFFVIIINYVFSKLLIFKKK